MMAARKTDSESGPLLEQVLGYLNFSSGSADPKTLAGLNRLYELAQRGGASGPAWQVVRRRLRRKLTSLRRETPTFQDADQAAAVLDLLYDRLLPEYLQWHRDLLFHQNEESLFGPFFVGRAAEAILREGPPWCEADRIAAGAISRLNDYLGHRPVATLETQKIEPYAHEWIRPVPLYIRGAGTVCGRYGEVVRKTLDLLAGADESLLRAACFDPDLLDELAFDPCAYDFDHPANRRPNYHFGQWDPHRLDQQGRYRRFVVQQVTLDALLRRCEQEPGLPREELLDEAAAVLAGTVLMAAGVSGAGPETHDSTVTLATLLPRIVEYRDAFYERLLGSLRGKHGKRLREEAIEKRQPFGAARQHLNTELARRRASQLEHVHLAQVFAQMGYPQAAAQQAAAAPVASARMLCQIDCLLVSGYRAVDEGRLEEAAAASEQVMDLLRRAIDCGAVIDPWNILGFDANYSLFPSLENSIHDHRADEVVELMDRIFAYLARVWTEAAAADDQRVCERIGRQYREIAEWWRRFAVHEVSSVHCADPLEAYHAAEQVARSLNLWHKGGAAAESVAFWAPHAESFDAAKAYALVIESLLDRRDFVASLALLSKWLGQAARVGLRSADASFPLLAHRWIFELRRAVRDRSATEDAHEAKADLSEGYEPWPLVQKFFDYLEANAEDYWNPPRFALGSASPSAPAGDPADNPLEADEDQETDLFGAAYENVVYRDSTDDGVDGEIFDTQQETHDELMWESSRVTERLALLSCLARLWRMVAISPEFRPNRGGGASAEATRLARVAAMRQWAEQAAANGRGLMNLLQQVRDFHVPDPAGDYDSMLQYDRKRSTKESLLERIIETAVDTSDGARMLSAAIAAAGVGERDETDELGKTAALTDDQRQALPVLAALFHGDVRKARRHWPALMESLAGQPLLYVPAGRGGDPRHVLAVRMRQHSIQDLLVWFPRAGMVTETCELIDAVRKMERDNPVGPGAVTEFDELFKTGYRSLVETLVASSPSRGKAGGEGARARRTRDAAMVACLERLTESLLISWLTHSRTLRLSVLERVADPRRWTKLVAFIKRYGADLFTQQFLGLGNVRAILHQGVESWLEQSQENDPDQLRLLRDLDITISPEEAAEHLTLVFEAIAENYGEYRDYNSTTTQSDRGDLLYTLLDFLRLRSQYDRICWNLKPVALAHEVLVRRGREAAARLWRRALHERIRQEADQYLAKLAALQKKYAMQMPTIADRLAERFVRPMEVDRMCALVEPAIAQARSGESHPAFELLEKETEALTRQPTGVGLDTPPWLTSLEDEVQRACRRPSEQAADADLSDLVPLRRLRLDQWKRQIDQWASRDPQRARRKTPKSKPAEE